MLSATEKINIIRKEKVCKSVMCPTPLECQDKT